MFNGLIKLCSCIENHFSVCVVLWQSFRGEINPPCVTVNREDPQKLSRYHMKLKPHHTRKKLQF